MKRQACYKKKPKKTKKEPHILYLNQFLEAVGVADEILMDVSVAVNHSHLFFFGAEQL